MNKKVITMTRIISVSLLSILCIIGCGRSFKESYDYKEQEGLIDKEVDIEKIEDRNRGNDITTVKVTFKEKEIPLTFDITSRRYPHTLEIVGTGFLESGKITAKLYGKFNGHENERWTLTIESGVIDVSEGFDFYEEDYKITFDYENAKNGDITFTYKLRTI